MPLKQKIAEINVDSVSYDRYQSLVTYESRSWDGTGPDLRLPGMTDDDDTDDSDLNLFFLSRMSGAV